MLSNSKFLNISILKRSKFFLGDIPFTKKAAFSMKMSYIEAKDLDHDEVYPEHIMLSIIKNEKEFSFLSSILKKRKKPNKFGLKYNEIKEEVVNIIAEKIEDSQTQNSTSS